MDTLNAPTTPTRLTPSSISRLQSNNPHSSPSRSPNSVYNTPRLRRNLFADKDKPNSVPDPDITDFQKIFNQRPDEPNNNLCNNKSMRPFQTRADSNNLNETVLSLLSNTDSGFQRHASIPLTLAQSLQSGYHSDITFLVRTGPFDVDGDQSPIANGYSGSAQFEIFPAHKLILSFASPVFDAMFFGAIPESGSEIQITDVLPEAFKAMLQFVYTGHLILESTDQTPSNRTINPENTCPVTIALSILYAARKYDFPSLETTICQNLYDCVNLSNVAPILEAALLYDCGSLQEKCWSYIEYYTDDFVRSPNFIELPKHMLEKLLRRDSLSIKELALFEGLERWAKAQVKAKEREPFFQENSNIIQNSRQFVENLIYFIRFPIMTASEFADGPAVSGILSQEEICNVLLYICSSKEKPRCIFPCENRRWKNPNIYSRCDCGAGTSEGEGFSGNSGTGGSTICNFCQPLQSLVVQAQGRQIENISSIYPPRRGVSSLLAPPTPPRYCSCRTRDFCPAAQV